MCTGRVDLAFIFRALANGKDGVFVGGCWPGECHYITEGNYLALSTLHIGRKLLKMIGVNPERLRLEWISASQGSRYAEVMNDFSSTVKTAGPLGKGEGMNPVDLKRKLDAIQNLIPYIKLVERERLRVSLKSVEEYTQFFTSDEFDRLFQELIVDKFHITMMMALLREKPCSIADISKSSGISPSEVSRYLNVAAQQGLGHFHESGNLISAVCDENGKKEQRRREDTDTIDQVIHQHKGNPGALIHVLMEIQSRNKWLSKDILDKISDILNVPLNRVMQIATFYKTFSMTPKGRHEVHVCTGTSCHLRGASRLMESVQDLMGIRPGETDSDSNFSLGNGNCLGCCSLGPEIIVDGKHHGRVTPAMAEQVLKNYA